MNVGRRYFDDLRNVVDQEAGFSAGKRQHNDALSVGPRLRRDAETAPQIDDRNDIAAQIDDAIDESRGFRQLSEVSWHARDFVDGGDGYAVFLRAQPEDDELLFSGCHDTLFLGFRLDRRRMVGHDPRHQIRTEQTIRREYGD